MLKQKKMTVLLLCIVLAFSGCSKLQQEQADTEGGTTYNREDNQTKEGNAPEGFYMGTEYSGEEINQSITENTEINSRYKTCQT